MGNRLLDLFDLRADSSDLGTVVCGCCLRRVDPFSGKCRGLFFGCAGVVGHVLMWLSHGDRPLYGAARTLGRRIRSALAADVHRFCKVASYVL